MSEHDPLNARRSRQRGAPKHWALNILSANRAMTPTPKCPSKQVVLPVLLSVSHYKYQIILAVGCFPSQIAVILPREQVVTNP
jgi:hypothetical protein